MIRDPAVTSHVMSCIRGKNTGIELALRKALTDRGVSYRLYVSSLPGHPDIVLGKAKIAIFADSEFWHGFNFDEAIKNVKTNQAFWIKKIQRNMARDAEVNAALKKKGYLVLRYWGKQIENDLDNVIDEIVNKKNEREAIFARKKAITNKTSLAYYEKDGSYLLLFRDKKENDPNEGKYVGIGGHLEKGESYLGCMKREFLEETGLCVRSYKYIGKVDFLNEEWGDERMYLFKVLQADGEIIDCDEGDLKFVKKEVTSSLPMWEGDKVFFPYLDSDPDLPVDITLIYEGNKLKDYFVSEAFKK